MTRLTRRALALGLAALPLPALAQRAPAAPLSAADKALVDRAPDHLRTPEAMLSIANCQSELKDNDSAPRTLEQLVRQHPNTEAAQAARDRLLLLPAAKAPARKGK